MKCKWGKIHLLIRKLGVKTHSNMKMKCFLKVFLWRCLVIDFYFLSDTAQSEWLVRWHQDNRVLYTVSLSTLYWKCQTLHLYRGKSHSQPELLTADCLVSMCSGVTNGIFIHFAIFAADEIFNYFSSIWKPLLLLLNEITEKHHVFQEQSNDLQINTPMKF